jgi:hypothetical protein
VITKDNIAEVLKHNNLNFRAYRNCIQLNNDDPDNNTVIDLDHVNLIPIIEAHYGKKLEPLPEPNPFEVVLKIGDEIESHHSVRIIEYFDYVKNRIIFTEERGWMSFDVSHAWNTFKINGKQCKFKIPEFDFEQTLLDAGFKRSSNNALYACTKLVNDSPLCIIVYSNGEYYTEGGRKIKPNLFNAKLLIEAAAMLNELELVE